MATKVTYLDHHLAEAEARRTASRLPSTDDLELTSLPERLDDALLARVQDIADAPLRPLEPCSERHLSQCLRVMQAVLPKRNSDDVSGELFVAAYLRKLVEHPHEQISYLADKAMERCHWFPTIAECFEIMAEWRRDDDAVQRRRQAYGLAARERSRRAEDARRDAGSSWGAPEITQEAIDTMPQSLVNIGLRVGSLMMDASGKVVPAPTKEV